VSSGLGFKRVLVSKTPDPVICAAPLRLFQTENTSHSHPIRLWVISDFGRTLNPRVPVAASGAMKKRSPPSGGLGGVRRREKEAVVVVEPVAGGNRLNSLGPWWWSERSSQRPGILPSIDPSASCEAPKHKGRIDRAPRRIPDASRAGGPAARSRRIHSPRTCGAPRSCVSRTRRRFLRLAFGFRTSPGFPGLFNPAAGVSALSSTGIPLPTPS